MFGITGVEPVLIKISSAVKTSNSWPASSNNTISLLDLNCAVALITSIPGVSANM